MLSSANKSVPTLKQFIQPYFIEIAPDGAITATCARFFSIFEKNNIYNHLGKNFIGLFLQLGTLYTECDTASLSSTTTTRSIDLSVNRPGSRSFLIRWTPAPANEPVEGGWQFTGVRIHTNMPAIVPVISAKKRSARAQRKTIKKDGMDLAGLAKYSSDIIVATDTKFQVIQWNKAAEKCYGISARHAIGKNFLELIRYEYVNSTLQEAERLFLERGYWEGGRVYLPLTEKNRIFFGFHPDKVKIKKGLVLSNIMSGADLFSGKVTIMSAPGDGCKLRVQVPVI